MYCPRNGQLGFIPIASIGTGISIAKGIVSIGKKVFGGETEEEKNAKSEQRLLPLIERVKQMPPDLRAGDEIRCRAGLRQSLQMRGTYCPVEWRAEDVGPRRDMWLEVSRQMTAAGLPTSYAAKKYTENERLKAVIRANRAAEAQPAVGAVATGTQHPGEVAQAQTGAPGPMAVILPIAAAGLALLRR